MYIPVLVSTKISSPMLTKSGTVTTAPVSTVAGFDPPTHIHQTSSLDIVLKKRFVKHYLLPCAVSPRRPGSTSTTLSVTVFGSSKSMTLQKPRQEANISLSPLRLWSSDWETKMCVWVCVTLSFQYSKLHSIPSLSHLVLSPISDSLRRVSSYVLCRRRFWRTRRESYHYNNHCFKRRRKRMLLTYQIHENKLRPVFVCELFGFFEYICFLDL